MSYHGSIYSAKFHPLDLQIFGQLASQSQAWRNENHTKIWSEWLLKKKIIVMLCEMYPYFFVQKGQSNLWLQTQSVQSCLVLCQVTWRIVWSFIKNHDPDTSVH